jgi:hypothetical protein
MSDTKIRQILDETYRHVENNLENGESVGPDLPPVVKRRIDQWKFGGYGWTSPVNLLMTAAWVKHVKHTQDVCLIWARNTDGEIVNGFSIRSMDEKFTVPFVNKYTIFDKFCSYNSGMQGTRALEKCKLREDGTRLERDTELGQKVRFDIVLFQNIMNDINDLNSKQALDVFAYFVEIALKVKKRIADEMGAVPISRISDRIVVQRKIVESVESFNDPQFVKIVVAAILELLIEGLPKLENCSLKGVEGSQTSADTQSGNPGDLWIEAVDGSVIVGCEVKDTSKTIGFDVLAAVDKRTCNHANLTQYFLVSAAMAPVAFDDLCDPQWGKLITDYASRGIIISTLSVKELLGMAEFSADVTLLPDKITTFLKVTSNLKLETVKKWAALIADK